MTVSVKIDGELKSFPSYESWLEWHKQNASTNWDGMVPDAGTVSLWRSYGYGQTSFQGD